MPRNVIDATQWLKPNDNEEGLRSLIFEQGDSRGKPTRTSHLEISGEIGTHILAPQHTDLNGKTLSDLDPKTYFGEGVVLRFQVTRPDSVIGMAEVQASAGVALLQGDVVLICNRSGSEFTPMFTPQAGKWLVDLGAKLVGFDENIIIGDGQSVGAYSAFLDQGVPIIKNLTNLNQIEGDRVAVMALPLAIEGLISSPCRVLVLD